MRIDVEIDRRAYGDQVETFMRRVVEPAVVDGVNSAAEAVRARFVQAMRDAFDNPTDFTLNGLRIFPAAVDQRSPAALIRMMPRQASYLALQVDGGTRTAGDYGTTRAGPLVPGPDATLDRNGNLPRNFVRDALLDPTVEWVDLDGRGFPVLVRRGSGRLEILAVIAEEVEYEPTFDFDGIFLTEGPELVEEAIRESLAQAIARAERDG